jgi:hypothetical protein
MGSAKWKDRRYKGYVSPYLSLGSIEWSGSDFSATASGLSFLPWLPLIGDLLNFRIYSTSKAGNVRGYFTQWDAIALPGLGIGLFDSRSAGIEKDFRLVSFWDIHLYRSTLDLPGVGYSPHLLEFDTDRLIHRTLPCETGGEKDGLKTFSSHLLKSLDEARSGNPVDHIGLMDPMIVFERRGEDTTALGIEPVFYYDQEEGFSLPLLLTTFKDGGLSLGYPSYKHLFPLLHGNKEGTRYDFLAHWGTCYRFDGYTAFDLKLLFNYQHDEDQGTAWGFLPFFGNFPRRSLRDDVRFVQLPGHVLSYWNMKKQKGFELLAPFLFSWISQPEEERWRFLLFFGYAARGKEKKDIEHNALVYNYREHAQGGIRFGLLPFDLLFHYKKTAEGTVKHSSLWSLLHSYKSSPKTGKEGKGRTGRFTLGPFGFLFHSEWEERVSVDTRILLLFGFESDEEKVEFDILGIPIYRSFESSIPNRKSD